jgi:hypothetical protein
VLLTVFLSRKIFSEISPKVYSVSYIIFWDRMELKSLEHTRRKYFILNAAQHVN